MVVTIVVFLFLDVFKTNPQNLKSLIGLLGFNAVLFLVSKNPAKVKHICKQTNSLKIDDVKTNIWCDNR